LLAVLLILDLQLDLLLLRLEIRIELEGRNRLIRRLASLIYTHALKDLVFLSDFMLKSFDLAVLGSDDLVCVGQQLLQFFLFDPEIICIILERITPLLLLFKAQLVCLDGALQTFDRLF
jgi:hypothetical protein